ncbi:DUF3006 domain-containing protein [Exiguobacterium antarcticum]|uniref:DUF3006 domain-containing protein n=1 Tax=Exiguobacterium antarcticum TaxID=132920 RepID=A0ABT6R5M3_9BACL|nr:DUF3006 domain-containing protein [Exiguobacterium antarcticum]MDI3236236.1 DUF3006 domain-containing protein [Exiguobacterium antarcticum]
MKMTLTEFAGELAICETDTRETIQIARDRLPQAAAIGDWLEWRGRSIRILRDETNNRRQEIDGLMDELFED